jgi:two-component system sensor histidine kinase BaeS
MKSDLRGEPAPTPTARHAPFALKRLHLPRIRFGITLKMFFAVLLACLTISMTMGYAVRLSFENGFLHYVRDRDAGRVRALMSRVRIAYASHGSWDFLRDHPENWTLMLEGALEDSRRQETNESRQARLNTWRSFANGDRVRQWLSPNAGEPSGWGMRAPSPPPATLDAPSLTLPRDAPPLTADRGDAASRTSGAPAPLPLDGFERLSPPGATLLDANKQLVASSGIGPPQNSELKPVTYNDQIVGWLYTGRPDSLFDAADVAFQAQQMRATVQIAAVAVFVAALVALLLARVVLAPVKRLMNATHRLANGDFTTRVPAGRRDELGKLAGDFNVLANSLQKAERMRRDFIADISHELRTPLAVLRSEIEAMEDGVHAFNRDSLHSLQTEVTMLNAIVEDLYELSLSDVGAFTYEKAAADVGYLTASSVDAFREAFRAKRIDISLTLPASRSGLPLAGTAPFGTHRDIDTPVVHEAVSDADTGHALIFEVDADRYVQLLKNLLQNSLRYTDPGGEVNVALSVHQQGWRLTVQDSAPAVPVDALPHLFDRLYRVDASRSRRSGGAGLGLALCSAIVAAHGGTIDARLSSLGGIRITAHFPTGLTPS